MIILSQYFRPKTPHVFQQFIVASEGATASCGELERAIFGAAEFGASGNLAPLGRGGRKR